MLPVVTSPILGCCCASPPARTCVLSIQPHANMSSVCLAPANVVALSTTSATLVPSGDRYAGVGPWIAYVCTVAPVQLRTWTWLNAVFSHSAPAGVAEPTRTHELPPSVDLRPAVAGSTT